MQSSLQSAKIRVLIAEDQPHTRFGIGTHLASYKEFEILPPGITDRVQAMQLPNDIIETLKLVKQYKPDVVVMDIKWGADDFAGIKAAREIKDELRDTKVILCTQYCQREHVARAVLEGRVDGYVLKDEADPLPLAIRTVFLKDLPYFVPEVVDSLLAIIRTPSPVTPIGGVLGSDERTILTHIARGESNKAIATRLNYTETTIKNKVRAIYEKLGVSDEATRDTIDPRVTALLKGLETGDLNFSDLIPAHPYQ